ncbi:mitochondrial carrier [Piedraia hortae CBS 480.64]|uniref:Mitochondrial carrier n=1 Tax=Piedraia hortae CBS 480.64 TaxID=1314780 RepID=A0A6A7BQV5_9PEZI|nr:mitochondrial carrier [Piedraia hortae CBS 480.64]
MDKGDDISVGQKMLSAVSGSIFTSLLVTPLDVVRVRLQAQKGPSTIRASSFLHLPPNIGVTACCREVFWMQNHSNFCAVPVIDQRLTADCAAAESQRRTFYSTADGLRKIARNEGLRALWTGLSPTLAMSVPGNVIYFAGYDWLRTSRQSPMRDCVPEAYQPLIGGTVVRSIAAVVVSPIEMLRTRMQAVTTKEKSVMRATVLGLRDMVSAEGYRVLWRGLSLTLWRDVPFSALYWWGYETGRRQLNRTLHKEQTGLSHGALFADSFVAGAVSGAAAAFVTTPFDVGKTRRQTGNSPEQRRSMPRFLWHIFQTEGTSGLFRGGAARCLKVAPACAIMISSYEIGKRMAQR